jgi:hypothetical protein
VGDKTPPDLQGFLIPSAQFSATNLVAKDDATTPSTYTQAGNRTGVPKAAADSGMVLQGSGTQDEDGHIEIVCQRAGLPGLERGGFVWRDEAAGDTTSEFYGWDGPQLLSGISAFDWQTSNRAPTFTPDVIRLDNGTLFAIYGNHTATNQLLSATYNPSTSTWTKVGFDPDSINWTIEAATCLQLPKASGDAVGRILVIYSSRSAKQVDVVYSDDAGATWSIAGRRVLGAAVGGDIEGLRARYSNGQILLLAAWDDSGTKTHDQYASRDAAASFDRIEADFENQAGGESSDTPNIVPALGGGFVVCTHKVTTSVGVRVRRIATASQKLSTVSPVTPPGVGGAVSGTKPGVVMHRAEDGTLYLFVNCQATVDLLVVARSSDDGQVWETFADAIDMRLWGNIDAYFHTFGGESIGGRFVMLARHSDNGGSSYDPWSLTELAWGGPSRMTAPAHLDAVDFADIDYAAWGSDPGYGPTGTDLTGQLYVPIELPDQIGSVWTKADSGSPTVAIAATAELSITTGVGSTNYYAHPFDSSSHGSPTKNATQLFAEFAVELDSGSGDSTTTEVYADLKITDGNGSNNSTYIYQVTIRLSSAGYRIYDEKAGPAQVGSTQTVDLTSRKHIRVALDAAGNVRTWHCSDEHNRKWVAGVVGTGLTSGGAASESSVVAFGHKTAGANVSRWALVGVCSWTERFVASATGSAALSWTNPADLHGRSFPTEPALVAKGARVRAIDGPAYLGDTWDVVARYDHPVSFAFQDVDPSPRRLWRSTSDNSAIDLVVNLDATSGKSRTLGESIGIFVRGANFPAFTLSRWNGSAWVTVGTATGKIGPLAWRRNGEFVELDTGTTATISQFVRWGDFDSGTMKLDGSPAVYRKVERHTSGAWSSGTASRPVFQLADTKASDPTAGTEGELWTTDYGVVVHDHGNGSGSSIYRIQIPASETAANYYTGKFVVGGVHPFGWPHDRNWSMREEHDVDLVTRPGGMRTATKRGPPRRALEVTWVQTSIDETLIRKTLTASALPDYVAANANPSATRHSTISDVMGTLRMQSGPKDPVIFIRQIAPGQASQQYTTKGLWIHGRVETTDPQMDNVVGREATNPLGKLNTILIVEEV